jgi:hypothetical protein
MMISDDFLPLRLLLDPAMLKELFIIRLREKLSQEMQSCAAHQFR